MTKAVLTVAASGVLAVKFAASAQMGRREPSLDKGRNIPISPTDKPMTATGSQRELMNDTFNKKGLALSGLLRLFLLLPPVVMAGFALFAGHAMAEEELAVMDVLKADYCIKEDTVRRQGKWHY